MWNSKKMEELMIQIKSVAARIDEQQKDIQMLKKENQDLQELCSRFIQGKYLSTEEFFKYTEEQGHRLWHMQYSYDNQLSDLIMDHIEQRCPGNKKRLSNLKNVHKGKRCFVIGNGPSLKASDLDLLQNELTFAVNKITKIFPYTQWRPTYYFVSDSLYFSAQDKRMDQLPEQTCLLLDSKLLDHADNTRYSKAIWYNHIPRYNIVPEFSRSPDKIVHEGGSVLYQAIQFVIYMGISEIYLLGVDNNFRQKVLPDGRKVLDLFSKEPAHFYSSGEEEEQIMNSISTWMDYGNMKSAGIYDPDDMWKTVAYHCDISSVKIINSTRGGELEIFPRESLEDVLNNTVN